MANVIGSGSPLFATWSVPSPAPTLAANPTGPLEEEARVARAAISPSVRALLDRVTVALQPHPAGLALGPLREALGVPATELRVAIDAGLRARSIRRTGAGSTLRYVLNPAD
jgi:hypothetical protein